MRNWLDAKALAQRYGIACAAIARWRHDQRRLAALLDNRLRSADSDAFGR
jgi:hypothetical protein